MIMEDDFAKNLNKQTFYLAVVEAMSRNLCKKGERFLEHICNGYFFNCYSKNDIHQINVFSDPVKQKKELETKDRYLEEMFYHIEVFRTRIIPKYRLKYYFDLLLLLYFFISIIVSTKKNIPS